MNRLLLLLALLYTFSHPVLAAEPVTGIDHLGLSVTDLAASEQFFAEYGNFKTLGRNEQYPAVFLGNGFVVVTLWQIEDTQSAIQFDRKKNVGLHHVALSVTSFAALDELYRRLQQDESVRIEFAPELLGGGPARHMIVYEPSGNRVEFVHRPPRT